MYEIGVVVAVIIAIGEFAKLYVAPKWIPLLSMVLGLGAGLFFIYSGGFRCGRDYDGNHDGTGCV